MKILRVNLKKNPYNIIIGNHLLKQAGRLIRKLNIGTDAYIITNHTVKSKYGSLLSKSLISSGFSLKFKIVPDSEKSKSLETAYAVLKDLAQYDKKRQVLIVALGGGVVGDLSGFVASIYKRGVPYIQIPTTLLAQVDSAIGGKTAVDLTQAKNLVGAFYQPKAVLSDIAILQSLSLRQLRTGLAEVIKYGIIKDKILFGFLRKNHAKIIAKDPKALEFIITRSSRIKAKIVEQDELENKDIRTILNFGHTIGHAIEAAGKYKGYTHGEAIALGMLVASRISTLVGISNCKTEIMIEELIKISGLPVKINKIPAKAIIKAHYFDKKFSGSKNKFVLVKKIGETKIVKDIPLKVIEKALSGKY